MITESIKYTKLLLFSLKLKGHLRIQI